MFVGFVLEGFQYMWGGVASALGLPSRVPVQEIGIKARHELIGPAGQTAHYNAQQGPTAGRRTLLPLSGSFSLFSRRGAPTVAAAALSPERCPGLPSPMQNLTAPGGPGNSNVTCSCNCTASQPQGMEI
eukprot:superscaffoldBa00001085_g8886